MTDNFSTNVKVTSPVAKFLIGGLAGSSAIAIPRLSSFLISGDEVNFDYFPVVYIAAIFVFSIFLGLLVTILEYKLPKPPKETFFAALAIPGLIAGSLTTAVETNDANKIFQDANELTKEVQAGNDIEVEQIDSIQVIPLGKITESQESGRPAYSFQIIRSAYAAGTSEGLETQNRVTGLSVQRDDLKYAISIGNFEDRNKAIEEAKKIRKEKPSATLIKTKNGYELLLNDKVFSETQATIEALKAKRELKIKPKLLKME